MPNRITDYKSFIYFVKKDRESQGGGNHYKKLISSSVYRFTTLLRLNEYLVNTKKWFIVRLFPLIWFRLLGIKLGFSIPINVFEEGLGIVHYGLIIVNPSAKIGRNCRIHAGVNIGASAGFKEEGDNTSYAPTIGYNCYIGPGAKLFGAIKIGDECVIGANAVVNKSFDQNNVTIAGIPAKVISNKGSNGLVYKI